MRFCWRMVEKIKGKFCNVFIFCVLKIKCEVEELQFRLQMAEEFDNAI